MSERLKTRISRAYERLARYGAREAKPAATIAVALLTVFSFLVGLGGIDFGSHWDEWYHVDGMRQIVDGTSLFLSSHQSYGGPYFYLGLPVLLVRRYREVGAIFHELVTRSPYGISDLNSFVSVRAFKEAANLTMASKEYLLGVRGVFLAFSCSAIVWAYLAMLRLYPKRYYIAAAVAAFVALSWQLQYHARMLAIDAPTAAVAALALFFFCAAYRARERVPFGLWYVALAAAAGMAFGFKAPAAPFIVPVLLLPWFHPLPAERKVKLAIMLAGLFTFAVFVFLVSPTLFVDPLHFLTMLRSGSADYNDDRALTHPHYVRTAWEHIGFFVLWMAGYVPSPYRVLAVLSSVVALWGCLRLARKERALMKIWAAFFGLFVLVFMRNHLMIPRQYLMWIPFWALAFGVGLIRLSAVTSGWARALVPLGVLVLVVANGSWAVGAMNSIRHPDPDAYLAAARDDLLRDARPVLISGRVYGKLGASLSKTYQCTASPRVPQAKMLVSYVDEHAAFMERYPTFERVYSSVDVDYDWYPSWVGKTRDSRIVVMRTSEIIRQGFDFHDTFLCTPTSKRS